MSTRRSALVCGCISALASTARAAPVGDRVRVGLDSNLLSYEGFVMKNGPEVSGSRTDLGLGAAGTGIGVGYGINDSLLLGARLLVAHGKQSIDGGGVASTSSVSIAAFPEYVFDGDEVRVFVGAGVGHRWTSEERGESDGSSSTTFLGPVIGLHGFVAPGLSLDPSAALFYETGSASALGTNVDRTGFAFVLGVGISGWLGGDAAVEASAPGDAGGASSEDVRAAVPATKTAEQMEAPVREAREREVPERDDSLAESSMRKRKSVTVLLGGADRLIVGPVDEGGSASVTVVASSTPELSACEVLTVLGSKREFRLEVLKRIPVRGGPGTLVALRAIVPFADVRAVARDPSTVIIDGCGATWKLGREDRTDLRDFVAGREQS